MERVARGTPYLALVRGSEESRAVSGRPQSVIDARNSSGERVRLATDEKRSGAGERRTAFGPREWRWARRSLAWARRRPSLGSGGTSPARDVARFRLRDEGSRTIPQLALLSSRIWEEGEEGEEVEAASPHAAPPPPSVPP